MGATYQEISSLFRVHLPLVGLTLNGEYQITIDTTASNTYFITASSNASSSATGGGTVTAAYQINTGAASVTPLTGWGAGLLGCWCMGYWRYI